MADSYIKMIKAASGWFIKTLVVVVFMGLTGWIGYNTHAGDRREQRLNKNCLVTERHESEIQTLRSMATRSTLQQEQIIQEIKGQGKTLAKIEEVLDLITAGKLRIER